MLLLPGRIFGKNFCMIRIFGILKNCVTVRLACVCAITRYRSCSLQLGQKSDQLQLLQRTLDERRAELLKAEAKLRETEEKYYSSAATINDKVKDDLRVEVSVVFYSNFSVCQLDIDINSRVALN